ncbi:MAG TPA: hypothetical protein VI911_08525 [Patescibacteria group bacterium]|nr:hypothetical protein [Patescibacteria group bacterium]
MGEIYTFDSLVKKWGDSLVLVLNNDMKSLLNLEEGDVVHIDISKRVKAQIVCPRCKFAWIDEEEKEVYDCPGCGAELIGSEVL